MYNEYFISKMSRMWHLSIGKKRKIPERKYYLTSFNIHVYVLSNMSQNITRVKKNHKNSK